MYSSHSNLNILTALLLAHGIEQAVVCPGSRNAAIVHNLHEAGLRLHPITDERSAAFVAIGLWIATRCPIVLCVTSGSALLNTLPGVAEAALRHIPLIVISADRPPQWIEQLDGQTLPQINALHPYAKTWHLPTPHDEEECWWVERMVNEALLATAHEGGSVVHLNVPLREPLFNFSEEQLPKVHPIREYHPSPTTPIPPEIMEQIEASRLLVVVVGERSTPSPLALDLLQAQGKALIYAECLSQTSDTSIAQALDLCDLNPDLILHIGGANVSKHFKNHLRRLPNCRVIRIDESQTLHDTFTQLSIKLTAPLDSVFEQLVQHLSPKFAVQHFLACHNFPTPTFIPSQLEAIFLGNSSVVRWGNRHFANCPIPIYGNRGTNGIEGSLSVAAGYALQSQGRVLCIVGDLSFFYDANALWNQQLDSRLRVLLINNGGGQIFDSIPGLSVSPVFAQHVKAAHHTTAEGIAQSYHCDYYSEAVDDFKAEATRIIDTLLAIGADRPVLFEVFTSNSLL